MSSWAASASICEKSGLMVRAEVQVGGDAPAGRQPGSTVESIPETAVREGFALLAWMAERVGSNSRAAAGADAGETPGSCRPGTDSSCCCGRAGKGRCGGHHARVACGRRRSPRSARPSLRWKRSELKGMAQLDDVALVVDPAGRVPDGVPLGPAAAVGGLDRVGLDAQRVDEEVERAPVVVEGVEEDQPPSRRRHKSSRSE